jgi:transposase
MIDNAGLIKALKKFNFHLLIFFIYKVMKKFTCYIGIDVSKLKLDVAVLYECDSTTKTDYYVIDNNGKSIAQLAKKVLCDYPPEQILFCFEDTGIYSLPLAYYLSDNGLSYWQVPAIEIKRSKGISRGKSDKTDSKGIAFYAYSHMHKFRLSSLSPKSIQKLRLLFSEREKILKGLSSFERTSENKDFVSKEVFNCVASINKSVVMQLKKALGRIEAKMLEAIASENNLNQQYGLLKSVPGIGMQTAIYLIIATKAFESFGNWRQMACYAGVAPFEYSSGSSIRGRTKVHPLADKKMKSLLNMCAIVAVRYDKELKTYYERKLKDGKPKMLVINNVRCKLLGRAFAVISRQTPYINTFKFAS